MAGSVGTARIPAVHQAAADRWPRLRDGYPLTYPSWSSFAAARGFRHSMAKASAERPGSRANCMIQRCSSTGLGLAMGQLKRTTNAGATVDIVAERSSCSAEAQRELRSISYLAHPPLLRNWIGRALHALFEGSVGARGSGVAPYRPELAVEWRAAEACCTGIQEALSISIGTPMRRMPRLPGCSRHDGPRGHRGQRNRHA